MAPPKLKRKIQKKKLSELTENLQVLATGCGCPFVEHDIQEAGPAPAPTEVGGKSNEASATAAGPGASDANAPQNAQNAPVPPAIDSAEAEQAAASGELDEDATDFNPATEKEKQDQQKCLCASCPTYARGAAQQEPPEAIYCQAGTSNLKPKMKGCLCPSCPVYKESKLIGWYFCTTGRAEVVTDMAGQGETETVPEGVQSQTPGSEKVADVPPQQPPANVSAPAAPSANKPQ